MPQRRTTRRSERRRTTRADARLSMRVEAASENGASPLVTESQNISASGVYCTSSHFLPPLSKVGLTIVLPRMPGGRSAKELIKCEGIVVRCQPAGGKRGDKQYELACMFSDLDAKRRALLTEFVTWRNLQMLRAAAGLPTPRAPRAAATGRARAAKAAKAASNGAPRGARKTAARRRGTVH